MTTSLGQPIGPSLTGSVLGARAGFITAAALDEAQRVAAEVAVLLAQGPLRRIVGSNTKWSATDTELELLRRLQDVDVALLRRRRLLRSRREELEQAQAWSQHVVLNKRRSATPLDVRGHVKVPAGGQRKSPR